MYSNEIFHENYGAKYLYITETECHQRDDISILTYSLLMHNVIYVYFVVRYCCLHTENKVQTCYHISNNSSDAADLVSSVSDQ